MTPVQEAAARLRRQYPLGSEDFKAVYGRDGPGANMDRECDLAECAMAYLAEHPADDAELITPEFLKSVGFGDVDSDCLVTRNAAENVVSYLKTVKQFFVQGRGISGIATRGDVRALLKGLKLPLTEFPATRQEPT